MKKESSLKRWMKDVIAIAKHKEGKKLPHRRSLRDMAVRNDNPQYLERRQTVLMWSMFGALGIVLLLMLFMIMDVHMSRASGLLAAGVYVVALTSCLVIPSLIHDAIYERVGEVRDYFIAAERDGLVFDEDASDDGDGDDDTFRCDGEGAEFDRSEDDNECHCGPDCRNREKGACCRGSKRELKLNFEPKAGELLLDSAGRTFARLASDARSLADEIARKTDEAADELSKVLFGGFAGNKKSRLQFAAACSFGGGGFSKFGGGFSKGGGLS